MKLRLKINKSARYFINDVLFSKKKVENMSSTHEHATNHSSYLYSEALITSLLNKGSAIIKVGNTSVQFLCYFLATNLFLLNMNRL